MKSLVLSNFPLTGLTCFALVLFFTLFSSACIWVYRKRSVVLYSHLGSLPLKDD